MPVFFSRYVVESNDKNQKWPKHTLLDGRMYNVLKAVFAPTINTDID